MSEISSFTSDKEDLSAILKDIKEGKIQLPDFQRGWVWDNEHLCSILTSISLSYPIGAVMFLQTGGETRFKPRPIEGVSGADTIQPERLILDGQQRLTSLFQALFSTKVVDTKDTRGYPLKRWYYLDIKKAVDPNADNEEVIISLPEDKILRNFRGEVEKDYSTLEKELQAELLPLSIIFDLNKLMDWQMEYFSIEPGLMPQRKDNWQKLNKTVFQSFQKYQIPTITLRKNTPKEAVCKVFEKVNTGGVSLNVFELLTATFAIDDFNLREDWKARELGLKQPDSNKVLLKLQNTEFLQVVSLLSTYDKRRRFIADNPTSESVPAVSCKRRDILKLTLNEYKQWADMAVQGYKATARLLFSQKIFTARDLPYQSQLVPLACILALLGDEISKESVKKKVLQWYWCGVLGELYGGANETRFAKDVVEVPSWSQNGASEPTTVIDASFVPARLSSLRTRNSAAYKGLYALLILNGVQDFRSGEVIDVERYFDNRIDIHHIFPQKWCVENGIEKKIYDSVMNKTPLSATTNRVIGGRAPSVYLERVQNGAGISMERMNEILSTHLISESLLRSDDFNGLMKAREDALLEKIELVMGKPIAREGMLPAVDVCEHDGDE